MLKYPFVALLFAGHLVALALVPEAQAQTKFDEARDQMVEKDIIEGGVKNERVIASMRSTPRHEFVAIGIRNQAYYDMSLPIGEQQTISAPFVVAYMTEQLDPQPTDKVLEIGTGSGYQAAVLSSLVKEVYSIEIVEPLGRKAAATLKRLRYTNVFTKVGDGYQGWDEHAPFDKIIVTCSPEKVPPKLVAQLKEGGRMVVPVGERYQQILYLFKKEKGQLVAETLKPTLFVPMTGAAEAARQVKPDPLNPKLFNSSFEEEAGKSGEPTGWHYQKLMKLVTAKDAPDGDKYVTFKNTLPGRGSRCLQGFPVDGRKIRELDLSVHVRGVDLRPGTNSSEIAMVAVTFYDDNRSQVGPREIMGPFRGSFPWQRETLRMRVPQHAREAIILMGLLGGVGEVSFDAMQLKITGK